MRRIGIENKYNTDIFVDDENKKIIKIWCDCKDFQNRRIKNVGNLMNKKFYSDPCKHSFQVVEALEKQGYTLKIPTENIGLDKINKKMKAEILLIHDNKCSFVNCEETENLQFHRVNRGNNGGKYSLLNTIPLCHEHHKLVHKLEIGCH